MATSEEGSEEDQKKKWNNPLPPPNKSRHVNSASKSPNTP